jgi:hypothetical protein
MPGPAAPQPRIRDGSQVSGNAAGQSSDGVQSSEDNDGNALLESAVHMACVYQAGRLGCAYYDTHTGEVQNPVPRKLEESLARVVYKMTRLFIVNMLVTDVGPRLP